MDTDNPLFPSYTLYAHPMNTLYRSFHALQVFFTPKPATLQHLVNFNAPIRHFAEDNGCRTNFQSHPIPNLKLWLFHQTPQVIFFLFNISTNFMQSSFFNNAVEKTLIPLNVMEVCIPVMSPPNFQFS